MSLRARLLLAQGPLIAALLLAALAGSAVVVALGRSAQRILQENYRSVLAAQRMKEAIERLDQAALFRLAGQVEAAALNEASSVRLFADELRVAQGNLTEPGERDATDRLEGLWQAYLQDHERLRQLPGPERSEFYFETLRPDFLAVTQAIQLILDLNQDAMAHKSERAGRDARRLRAVMVAVALGGCLLGLIATSVLTTRLLRPLGVLSQAARRIGQGDLQIRALVEGQDEVARLALEFNAMADQLRRYRESSLGELFEAQQASQATIDSLPDPVVVIDAGGHLQQRNEAAGALLGIELGVAQPLLAVEVAVREAIERAAGHVLAGKGAYHPRGLEEALAVRRGEAERYLLVAATPVYSSGGSVGAVTIVFQDVTRLRRFDELAGDLVATTAHEFRTPLTSLRMALHLCLERVPGDLNERQEDLLHAAREDCERLQNLVDELLDLSRLRGGALELRRSSVEAEELVRDAVAEQRLAAAERQVEVEARVLPGIDALQADRERIAIVLGNLLANAIRHAGPGTRVEVSARPDGDAVRFAISDRGAGIAPEHQQAIFERHFRLPGEGGSAGLGLYIAREIVRAHGGIIGVDSRVGQGSTFWFTLPLRPVAEDPHA